MSFVVSLSFSLSQHVRSSSQLLGMNNMLSSSGTNWMMVNLMGDQSFYHVLYHCTLYTLEFLLLPTSSFLSVFWMKFRLCDFLERGTFKIQRKCTYVQVPQLYAVIISKLLYSNNSLAWSLRKLQFDKKPH